MDKVEELFRESRDNLECDFCNGAALQISHEGIVVKLLEKLIQDSVAFIIRGGITPLLQTLQELERRGVPGRILTTDYLSFSDPVALDTITSLSNIELRMYQTERAGNGFHTKGYIYDRRKKSRIYEGFRSLILSL